MPNQAQLKRYGKIGNYRSIVEISDGEYVKYSDIEPLIDQITKLRQCCKDFQFVLEGSRAIKQSEEMLDKRDAALMRALGWNDPVEALKKVGI